MVLVGIGYRMCDVGPGGGSAGEGTPREKATIGNGTENTSGHGNWVTPWDHLDNACIVRGWVVGVRRSI